MIVLALDRSFRADQYYKLVDGNFLPVAVDTNDHLDDDVFGSSTVEVNEKTTENIMANVTMDTNGQAVGDVTAYGEYYTNQQALVDGGGESVCRTVRNASSLFLCVLLIT